MDYSKGAKDPAKDAMHQRMAIGGAHHLHEAGHISAQERDQFQAAARAKLGQAKPEQPPPPAKGAPGKMPAPGPAAAPPRPFGALA